MKMYSVMRATTKGFVDELDVDSAGMREGFVSLTANRMSSYRVGIDIFDTREQAVDVARILLANRVAGLRKTLARVEKMEIV